MKSAAGFAVMATVIIFAFMPLSAKEKAPPKEFTNTTGLKFVWLPAGSFLMGSPNEEEAREDGETQHKVTLSKGFYLGVHTVTQEQWQAVMGGNPSYHKGAKNLPVENVTWDDCHVFLAKMGKKDGHAYRLPTEAEWEYACRAGTTTAFHFGDSIASHSHANFNGALPYGKEKGGVFLRKTTPVGSYPGNKWGLHDMHGNVWQWCADWYADYPRGAVIDPLGPSKMPPEVPSLIKQLSSPKFAERQAATQALREIGIPALQSLRQVVAFPPDLETKRRAEQLVAALTKNGVSRVLRGGSFSSPAAMVRSANRSGSDPSNYSFDIGFRVVRDYGGD